MAETNSQKIMKRYHKQAKLCVPKAIVEGQEYIWMAPAYGACDDDPSKNYGISGVKVTFTKRKGNRVVDVSFLTDWHLISVQERNMGGPSGVYRQDVIGEQPLCTGTYRHEAVKPSDWYDGMYYSKNCVFTGGECWGEAGSAIYGDTIRNRLLEEGSVAVWAEVDRALVE